jgi:flagellar protein FliS
MTYPTLHPSRGAASYRQIAVQSRTPLELVVMLYDGALRFVAHARDAMARNDVAARQQGVSRALAIVSELQSTLDMQGGGAIAGELDRLYAYVTERLTAASITQDVAPLDDASRVLSTLRDGWVAISTGPSDAPNLATK